MKPQTLLAVILLLIDASVLAAEPLSRAQLLVGSHPIEVEVANTPTTRRLGLMHRTSLPPSHGMLFVFANDEEHCMWMRNTQVPLTVAFIDATGEIQTLADMAPLSDEIHCAQSPSRFALETNRGWFAARGIAVGTRLHHLERLPKAE